MKNHIYRPLFIAIILAAATVAARYLLVPSDFGVHERGYMYGWYRKSNEAEWQSVTVKYQTTVKCIPCHRDKYEDIRNSPHGTIGCENCHGPNLSHPQNPVTLETNRSRSLCLRCHAKLPYRQSLRGSIKGIDPDTHYHEAECVMCHYPHNPKQSQQERRGTS
jgi:predicted CXXCH cytochrome family protein